MPPCEKPVTSGLPNGGAGGYQGGERGGDPIGFPRDQGRGDVVADGVVPDVHAAARVPVREDEAGAAAVAPEQL